MRTRFQMSPMHPTQPNTKTRNFVLGSVLILMVICTREHFQKVMKFPSIQFMFSAGYLFCMVIEIASYCWLGNEIVVSLPPHKILHFLNMRRDFDSEPSCGIRRWNGFGDELNLRATCFFLPFEYAEADTPDSETAELYSYSEHTELSGNTESLRHFLARNNKPYSSSPQPWTSMSTPEQSDVVLMLMNQLEHKDAAMRLEASRCILYIAQGCWAEYILRRQWDYTVRMNVILLIHHGVLKSFVQQFNLEAAKKKRKPSNMFDTEALRVTLSVLYTVVDLVRRENRLLDCFTADDLIALILDLFNLLSCLAEAVVPVKKIVLLIWKLLLLLLGGFKACDVLKKNARTEAKLRPSHDGPYAEAKPKPKVYQADFEKRLMEARKKHLPDLKLPKDCTTLAGLPQPELASLRTLQSYIYVPLAQAQMENEEKLYNHPLTHQELVRDTPAELLYAAMLPHLRRNMTVLLYIMSTTNVTTSFNSLNESIKLPQLTDQALLSADIQRHNEIILKAISNIILLLLKHFKTNHILQFENLSQVLFNLETIDVIILFLHNNLSKALRNANGYPDREFPFCVLVDGLKQNAISWRKATTIINWLRILNKLTKRKHGRILHLFSFNIEDVLSPLARIQNNHMKLYSLKLIKMVLKYARRTWIRLNTDLITEMYYLVRSQLDTKYLNSMLTPIIPSHGAVVNGKEEKSLAEKIARFNRRRYDSDRKRLTKWEPSDNSFLSVLGGSSFEVPEDFKRHYEAWLQKEVFCA